jgi:serine/threonine-protein kinase RsbT
MPHASSCAAEAELQILPSTSSAAVQAFVRAFARRAGAGVRDEWCVAIAASEAATNAAKFADGGRLSVRLLLRPRACLEIVVEDRGPGLPDVERALADGFSEGMDRVVALAAGRRGRGLGMGLGAIRRAMHELEIAPRQGGGTRLVARRYLGG